jgi:mRNA interferase RelE/StbE
MVMRVYSYRLEWPAERFIKGLSNAKLAGRLWDAIRALRLNPFPPGCKKLRGRAGYRVRVGDFRIVYRVVENELLVVVVDIGDRKDIYR